MTEPPEDILKFPCEFPLKIIGKNEDDFKAFAIQFVSEFVPYLDQNTVQSRESNGGKYLSVSFIFIAESRAQVDAIYQAMSNQKRFLMAL
jgi:uncharacterized protein